MIKKIIINIIIYIFIFIIIIILVPVSEGHKLDLFLVPPLVHIHRFLVYLGVTFMRRYWIFRFSF